MTFASSFSLLIGLETMLDLSFMQTRTFFSESGMVTGLHYWVGFYKISLLVLWEFHTIYVDCILSPSPSLLRSSPTSLPTQLHIFFFMKTNIIIKKTNRKCSQRHARSLIYVSQPLVSLWPALGCGWQSLCHSTEKNWFTLSQQTSVANDFLVSGGTLCPLPCLCAGISPNLNLCRSCACCHRLCIESGEGCFLTVILFQYFCPLFWLVTIPTAIDQWTCLVAK